MRRRPQFARGFRKVAPRPFGLLPGLLACLLLEMALLGPITARAQQQPPPGAVARVEGNDISVESGTAAGNGTSTVAPSIYVVNGSVVTVHSGPARMTLFSGGEVDICGPAKVTVLQANGALTLALNFGRVRVQAPAGASLRIFTPSLVATPLEISGGTRDISVGLSLDESLCVLATSGAVQLEQQFSGEKLIVPQAGEFSMNAGKLVPVASAPGSCRCDLTTLKPAVPAEGPPREFAETGSLEIVPPTQPQAAPGSALPAQQPAPEQSMEVSVPAHANEAHPVAPAARNVAPAAPPEAAPVYTVVAPLTFSNVAPAPPEYPTPDMLLLIREARVVPEWEFSGRVAAPEFALALQHALGEGSSGTATGATGSSAPTEQKKRGGFWGVLKRIFSRSNFAS